MPLSVCLLEFCFCDFDTRFHSVAQVNPSLNIQFRLRFKLTAALIWVSLLLESCCIIIFVVVVIIIVIIIIIYIRIGFMQAALPLLKILISDWEQ